MIDTQYYDMIIPCNEMILLLIQLQSYTYKRKMKPGVHTFKETQFLPLQLGFPNDINIDASILI